MNMNPLTQFKENMDQYVKKNVLEPLLPWINERIESGKKVELTDILNFLHLDPDKDKEYTERCQYIFKKGARIHQRCNNLCLEGNMYCFDCMKRLHKNKESNHVEVIPDENEYGIFYDRNGFKLELLPDKTLLVRNEVITEEQKRKAQELGYKINHKV
jgi:hypothetical protein